MDNTNTNLEDAIKELGVPPVPPMPPVGAVPEGAPEAPVMPEGTEGETSAVDALAAELANPAPEPIVAPTDDAAATLDALVTDAPAAAPASETEAATPVSTEVAPAPAGELDEIKKNMLKDLFPIMDKVNVSPEQRFRIYREMILDTGDKSLIAAAYEAAKGIADDATKGEALLFLVESADK